MSLWNWITSGIFRINTKLDGDSHQKQIGLSDDTKQDINKLIYRKEKLYGSHKISEKDKQINTLEIELKEKQNTIVELEKLLLAQKRKLELTDTKIHTQKQKESIQNLRNEIAQISREHQEVIKKYEESIQELNNEIAETNNRYQEAKNKLEKEQDVAANLEKEIEDERRINSEYRKEIEAYEESIQDLRNEIAEINNRYQETIEKFDKVADNVVTLEMLILDLDKELGLFNIIEKSQKMEIYEAPIKI